MENVAGENQMGDCPESTNRGILEEWNKLSVNEGTVRHRQLIKHTQRKGLGSLTSVGPTGKPTNSVGLKKKQ